MIDFLKLDQTFKKYIYEIRTWSPDRMIEVDLALLQRLDLLNTFHYSHQADRELNRYFQVAETADKITLANEQFVIWILPEMMDEIPVTYVLIALNEGEKPQLELTFIAKGVYNSSRLVMRVLEKMLSEIQENEALLNRYEAS